MIMKNTNNDEAHILMEEYGQVYEHFRHYENSSNRKEAIFAVASFGVLAYVAGKCLPVYQLIGAGIISITLYLYHVIACERIKFLSDVCVQRLKIIEEKVNKKMNSDILDFQTCFEKKYEKDVKEEKEYKDKIRCYNPYSWLRFVAAYTTTRETKFILASVLFILWLILIFKKILG